MIDITKTLQIKEQRMLQTIVQLFESEGVNWFAACGTCLGAIRHKGFIPWDDDVDIYILGTDYERVKKIIDNSGILEWHDNQTKDEYPFTFPKIVSKNTELIEKGKEDVNYLEGVYIDVFPLIESFRFPIANFLYNKIRYFRYAIIRIKYTNSRSIIRKTARVIVSSLLNVEKIQKKIFDSYKKHRCGEKFLFDSGVFGRHCYLIKESFEKTEKVIFENDIIPVPHGYDKYLTDYYGDYMKLPPEENRVASHCFVFLQIDGVVLINQLKG